MLAATSDDIDRRHIVKVPVDKAGTDVVTPGKGLEWDSRFMTGDGQHIAFISATSSTSASPDSCADKWRYGEVSR
jgi:hypothetical protein